MAKDRVAGVYNGVGSGDSVQRSAVSCCAPNAGRETREDEMTRESKNRVISCLIRHLFVRVLGLILAARFHLFVAAAWNIWEHAAPSCTKLPPH